MRAFERNAPVIVRNPHATRPWQHVLEPLTGYLTLAERLYTGGQAYAEGWNFGPICEDAKPVGWIVDQIAAMWGHEARWQIDAGEHPHEANYLKLDNSKARTRLDWRPALRLNEALKLIVDWSKQRSAGAEMRKLTLDQIRTYQTLIQN